MSANCSCFEWCSLCFDGNDVSEEEHDDAQDPVIIKHRLRFLDYPQYVHNFDEPKITIIYTENSGVPRERWNSAFQKLVDDGLLTDLPTSDSNEGDRRGCT